MQLSCTGLILTFKLQSNWFLSLATDVKLLHQLREENPHKSGTTKKCVQNLLGLPQCIQGAEFQFFIGVNVATGLMQNLLRCGCALEDDADEGTLSKGGAET